MKTIKISVTDEVHKLISIEAEAKGLKPSSYVKNAMFSYLSKYACKGILKDLYTYILKTVEDRTTAQKK